MFGKYFFVLFLLTLHSECYGLRCYSCTQQSLYKNNCDNVEVVNCSGKCIWARASMNSLEQVVKLCSPSDDYCSLMERITQQRFPEIKDIQCKTCNTDLCNSGSTITSAIVFILFAATYTFW